MWKEYLQPSTLDEALEALLARDGTARIIAGATDAALQAQAEVLGSQCVIDITGIAPLASISEAGGVITLGPCATHAAIAGSALIRAAAPLLAEACAAVGSPQIRNTGTVGGNLVNAQPAADAVIALLALNAAVEVHGRAGARSLPVADCFAGPGKSALDPTREIVTAISFHGLKVHERSAFRRLARRRALALPVLNVAVVASVDGGRFEWVRIAMGPVAPTPFRAAAAEGSLLGAAVSEQTVARAAALAAGEANPRSNVLRGSKEYRHEMVRVLVARALREAAGLAEA